MATEFVTAHELLFLTSKCLKPSVIAIAKAGPSLWNELPVDIRRAALEETFKSPLIFS